MIRKALEEEEILRLSAETDRLQAASDHACVRDLLRDSSLIREFAISQGLRWSLPAGHQPVRAILFDKTPSSNWPVAWHQDLTIAVVDRREVPGYGAWTCKNGVQHVQPPVRLLESMITLRFHLDPTRSDDGPLSVIPGSHRSGRLTSTAIAQIRARGEIQLSAEAGDLLMMRPLLLHASGRARNPSHRRVIHLEYAPVDDLATELRWAEAG